MDILLTCDCSIKIYLMLEIKDATRTKDKKLGKSCTS